MAFDPLAPAPRLPEDTAVASPIQEGSLGACLTSKPGGPHQLSLIQTQTTTYWGAGFDRMIYDKPMGQIQPDQASLEARVRPVLQEFAKKTPKPPQNRGKNS